MIQRIVCFKFKAGTSDQAIQRHLSSFAALKDAMPYIQSYRGGRALSGDRGAAPAFDTLHYLIFDSMADIDAYFVHEAHQQFIQENREIWESVLVLNGEVGL